MVHDFPIIAALELGMDEAERIAFQHAMQFDLEPLKALGQMQFNKDPIRYVAASFEKNLLRALDPLGTPAYIIYWTRTSQRAEYEANEEITGSPFPPAANGRGNAETMQYGCSD